ncbi:hypothetical protein AB0I16_11665 [Streptomyces sp. NPDC050703]|uniref:hypothetical protein n=1 Tax=Streptomyces sp. NPDC050703 TaxID=3157218 RepID=UPI00343546DC
MAEAHAAGEQVAARVWTVRLDAAGRGLTAVKVDCSRAACTPQRLGSAAQGRAFAAAHLRAHLRAAGGPRGEAACACRADGCQGHAESAGRGSAGPAWRCGGAVVLAVLTDPMGRWWRAWECCARCAAAHPAARVVATAPEAAPAAAVDDAPVSAGVPGVGAGVPLFSAPSPDAVSAGGAPAGADRLPAPRAAVAKPRRAKRSGKIAQRHVPHDLQPTVLRDELIELGDAFRAYQSTAEPDLARLAGLHERKALAFTTWAEVTGDASLRAEARRAEQAAATALAQHAQRTGEGAEGVTRLLTGPNQWEHARAVLAHVRDHAPVPGPEARLVVLMLTLRSACGGSGNVTGLDLKGWPLTDAEQVLRSLVDAGWLRLPGTVADLLASGSDNPTHVRVDSLLAPDGVSGVLGLGRTTRAKLSGWAQKTVGERKLRKKRLPAAARLLALVCAAHSSADGRLGALGGGLDPDAVAALCAVDASDLGALVEQLTAAEWFADVSLTDTRLTGCLSERVLPLGCPFPAGTGPASGGGAGIAIGSAGA